MIAADPVAGEVIGLADLPRLVALLAASPRAPSEYSLANLFLYRARHGYRLVDDEMPFVLGETYDGERHALPLGPLNVEAADRLLDHAACVFPLAEDEAVALAAAGGFAIDDRETDADYLYDTGRLAALDGAKAKRAQAAAFGREGPRLAPFDADAARHVLAGWIADAARGPDHADAHECAEAIARRAELGLDGVTVHLADEPVAFLLAGPARGGDRIVHFAKGKRALAGAYPWMFSRFAGMAGVEQLNFEQDLGNPGLAQAKRALAPSGRVCKFRLRRP